MLECHKVTGVENFILKVAVSSSSHLDHLIETLKAYGDSVTSVILNSPVPRRSISRNTLRAQDFLN